MLNPKEKLALALALRALTDGEWAAETYAGATCPWCEAMKSTRAHKSGCLQQKAMTSLLEVWMDGVDLKKFADMTAEQIYESLK